MRTWLIVLMMVLLPLRAWAGGAMAMEHSPLPMVDAVQLTGASPCHGPAAEATPGDDTATAATCSLCDVCHSQLIAAASTAAHPALWPLAAPPVAGEPFFSAQHRLRFKPPKA